jgi:hypothetical protein
MAFGDKRRIMLVAEVRLLANACTPIYHIIVGDVSGEAKVAAVLDKLGPGEFRDCSGLAPVGADGEHWLPRTWPLPFLDQHRDFAA